MTGKPECVTVCYVSMLLAVLRICSLLRSCLFISLLCHVRACFLQGNEKVIYEFVVRHFLACCSKDAQGQETTVEINVNNEVVNVSLDVLTLYQLHTHTLMTCW